MSTRRASAPAPASRLQHVLEVGMTQPPEPLPTELKPFRFLSSTPTPSTEANVVITFLERFLATPRAKRQSDTELRASWARVEILIDTANIGRTTMMSKRVTPVYPEALWIANSITAKFVTTPDRKALQPIGMQLWAELKTLPEEKGGFMLSRLVACNWWWYRFATDIDQNPAAAEKYKAQLQDIYDTAIKAFRGQHEKLKGAGVCEKKTKTPCTHVAFTFEQMMERAKRQLLVTEWGAVAMYTNKERMPPAEAYAVGAQLLSLYTL